ncbi:hypothetical protein I0C86_18430 [Plantactinospora sp. S1510]|uniref:Dehydrogenase (DH) domain-containing protein n=1 Tax=Plantactinospora alkalitolerans TaxID=2789879 RepID=A0ABS0GXK7_9ACTN|nr:hypothetical protein [Plantactinospora alkalitolerans]MBF9130920.1 hypothetical protein [Plantactinospora alkalitolerans]
MFDRWASPAPTTFVHGAPSAVLHGAVLRVFARANDGPFWQNHLVDGQWTWQDLAGGIGWCRAVARGQSGTRSCPRASGPSATVRRSAGPRRLVGQRTTRPRLDDSGALP